jgi:hypothetical protein
VKRFGSFVGGDDDDDESDDDRYARRVALLFLNETNKNQNRD